MWIFKANMSFNTGNRHEQMPSNTGRSRAVAPIHIHVHQGFLPSGEALGCIMVSSREPPTLLQQSKAQQQLQYQIQSATTIQAAWRGYQVRRELDEMKRASTKIQAAWRGYQVRRELDEMNKAAVKIQAAYRGHMVRQALPPGFYKCLRDKRAEVGGKKKEEKGTMTVLGVAGTLECKEISHVIAATFRTESTAGCCRDGHSAGSDAAVYSSQVYFTASQTVNREDNIFSFEILPAVTSKQQVQNAADKIQAAEGLDKMGRPSEKISGQNLVLTYNCQLKQNACENSQIPDLCSISGVLKWTSKPKDTVPYSKQNLPAQLEMKKGGKASDADCNAPSIRKVEVRTVMRNLPASQQWPMSLRVSSPNGTVECFQQDIVLGQLHGMYSVRRLGGSQPACVSVCMRVVEEGREAGESPAW
ncbi:uncharacterized protein LOC107306403 [Coturnix japonica]|uniref:uncharacterized protein LOC107306403 n=1 Tax=Coturnix japonica TaxID=93934 RepID=UPI0007781242|nr:uncharacterized protein LOC107306403 [Coturnix japonica]